MKNVYWKKVDVWCEYPFHQEIDHREIHFYSNKKCSYKNKYDFICDSQIVGKDRIKFVAEKLEVNPKNINLIKL